MRQDGSTNSVHGKLTKVMIAVLYIASVPALHAQLKSNTNKFYVGVGVSFGVRTTTLTSDIEKINRMPVVQNGGSVSVVGGYRAVKMKVGLAGFYYSAASMAQTTDLFQADIMCNVYPVMMLTRKSSTVEPYLTGGMVYNKLKFFGYYGGAEVPKNCSYTEQPFVGTISQSQLAFGAGLMVKVVDDEVNFISVYSEMRYGVAMGQSTKYTVLENTKVGNQTMISLGLRFGRKV